jgi:hypothetical protein
MNRLAARPREAPRAIAAQAKARRLRPAAATEMRDWEVALNLSAKDPAEARRSRSAAAAGMRNRLAALNLLAKDPAEVPPRLRGSSPDLVWTCPAVRLWAPSRSPHWARLLVFPEWDCRRPARPRTEARPSRPVRAPRQSHPFRLARRRPPHRRSMREPPQRERQYPAMKRCHPVAAMASGPHRPKSRAPESRRLQSLHSQPRLANPP